MTEGASCIRSTYPPDPGPASTVRRTADPRLGILIDGRYRVEARIGEGGMGLVYRAMHVALNKPVAIKVLQREASQDEEVLARFTREAQSASAIGNEHIVDVSDFGVLDDGAAYFVMEHLDGEDLIEAIDKARRMAPDRAIHIAKQLCRALGAAHEAGIIHRDLKPENVLLVTRGEDADFVKILDFGIAKVADGHQRITRTGEVFGTPHYMSPEQCQGEDVDERTDIYALGVLLYEMVTGNVPHDADTMMGILTKQLYETPVPPTVKCPQVPRALEEVILRCLHKDPAHRYATMAELETDLERVERGAELLSRPTISIRSTRPPSRRRTLRLRKGLGFGAFALLPLIAFWALSAEEPVPHRTSLVADDTVNQVKVVAPIAEQPAPSPQPLGRIHSKPQRAEVWANGELQGHTPFELSEEALGWQEIVLVRKGYEKLQIEPKTALASNELALFDLKPVAAQTKRSARLRKAKPKPARKKPAAQSHSVLVDPWSSGD